MTFKVSDRFQKMLFENIKTGADAWPPDGECVLGLDLAVPRTIAFDEANAEPAKWLADGFLGPKETIDCLRKMIGEGNVIEITDPESSSDAVALLERIARVAFLMPASLLAHWPAIANKRKIIEILSRLADDLEAIRSELRISRSSHVQSQLTRLGITPGAKGLKLNIGAGDTTVDGWINVDVRSKELSLNISEGLPFENECVKYIYSSHILEHFHYKGEALGVLKEFKRILQSDGVIRIVVPDSEVILQAYARKDREFFEQRKTHFYWERICKTPLEQLLRFCGATVKPADFFRHKFGYDFETLRTLIIEAGFSDVQRSEYMGSKIHELNQDHRGASSSIKLGGAPTSLFVEARFL